MPRQISTVIAGVFRFDAIIRKEGARGRRIAVPKPIVRGLLRTGWQPGRQLKIAAGGASWTAAARKMGNATVLALPVSCSGQIGSVVTVELWQAAPEPRRFVDE